MLTILHGTPGAGKSYYATWKYVMPALRMGRKVLTNIPMNLEEVEQALPGSSYLIDQLDTSMNWDAVDARIRATVLERKHDRKCRGILSGDFLPPQAGDLPPPTWVDCDCEASKVDMRLFDAWEHPTVKGMRAMIVLDEAREWLHSTEKKVPLEIETLFSKHRHAGYEIVIISQNMTDLYMPVRKLSAFNVKLKNLGALGIGRGFIASTCEGWERRNSVGSAEWRFYQRDVYRLYNSYSLGGANIVATRRKRVLLRPRNIILLAVVLVGIHEGVGVLHVPRPKMPGQSGAPAVALRGPGLPQPGQAREQVNAEPFGRAASKEGQAPRDVGDVEADAVNARIRAVGSNRELGGDFGQLGHQAWPGVGQAKPFEGGVFLLSASIGVDGDDALPDFLVWRSDDRRSVFRYSRAELRQRGFDVMQRGRALYVVGRGVEVPVVDLTGG